MTLNRYQSARTDDQILALRAALRDVTDLLEDILKQGVPKKGRSADDQDAVVGWWDDVNAAITRAHEALKATETYDNAQEGDP